MTYTVPRPLYEVLAENLKDRKAADAFARSIEDAVDEISKMAEKETIEKMSVSKMEIKENLVNTLVTRELFEEKFTSQNSWINERFQSMQEQMNMRFQSMQEQMDMRFQSMQEQMDMRFQSMQEQMDMRFKQVDMRFKHMDFKFNILIGISLLGFTLLNPEFIGLIKMFFR